MLAQHPAGGIMLPAGIILQEELRISQSLGMKSLMVLFSLALLEEPITTLGTT